MKEYAWKVCSIWKTERLTTSNGQSNTSLSTADCSVGSLPNGQSNTTVECTVGRPPNGQSNTTVSPLRTILYKVLVDSSVDLYKVTSWILAAPSNLHVIVPCILQAVNTLIGANNRELQCISYVQHKRRN